MDRETLAIFELSLDNTRRYRQNDLAAEGITPGAKTQRTHKMTKQAAYITSHNFLQELTALLKIRGVRQAIQTLLGDDDILPINTVQAAEEILGSGKGLAAVEIARTMV